MYHISAHWKPRSQREKCWRTLDIWMIACVNLRRNFSKIEHASSASEVVFHACSGPAIFLKIHINFLCTCCVHSRRMVQILAHELYSNAKDLDFAVQAATLIISYSRRARNKLTEPSQEGPHPHTQPSVFKLSKLSSKRIVHNVAMWVKDIDSNFDGNLGDCWNEQIDSYEQTTNAYNLTIEKKLQYLDNILFRDALRFYHDFLQPFGTTYLQAVEMIDREYNSPVRQNRIYNYLNMLRVCEFEDAGLDGSVCLSKIY